MKAAINEATIITKMIKFYILFLKNAIAPAYMWSESVLIVSLPLLLDIIFAVLTAANKSAIIPAISPTYTAFEPCAYIPNDVKRPAISTIQNKISQKGISGFCIHLSSLS